MQEQQRYVRSIYYQPRKKRKASFLFFSAIIVGLIIFTLKFALTLPYFYVKSIQVKGLNRLLTSEILQEAHIPSHTSIFELDINRISQRIQLKPLVKKATIKRILPSTILIKISERLPCIYVEKGGKFWEVDEEGVVLRVSQNPKDLPLVYGIDPFKEDKKLSEVLQVLKFSQRLDLPLEKVLVKRENRGIVAYLKSGIPIVLGNTPHYSYLYHVPAILQDVRRRGEKITHIDLRFEDQVVVSCE